MDVGWSSLGSFTTSFRRLYGCTPTAYRERYPPARDLAQIPTCVLRYYGLPQNRTFREAPAGPAEHHPGQSTPSTTDRRTPR